MDFKKAERHTGIGEPGQEYIFERPDASQQRFIDLMVRIGMAMKTTQSIADLSVETYKETGYSDAEVSTAISWLVDKITFETGNFALPYEAIPSIRMFNDTENARIAMPAKEYLIQLRELRLLSQNEFERIVDKIVTAEDMPITGIEQVKTMAATVIFANADANRTGSRLMLNRNDTIH